MIDRCETARTVRAFLKNPAGRHAFDEFFALSLRLARAYIAMRVRRGSLHVPANEYPLASAVDDCACECLGTLFASKPGRPFCLIIDYFGSRITDETLPDRIHALLQGMIAGHVDQELMRFNPQGVAIRRAVLRAMNTAVYEEIRLGGRDHWALRSAASSRRETLPAVDDATLQQFINHACRGFADMPERCRAVFDQLNQDDRFANLLECRRFASAVIRVLTDHDDTQQVAEANPRTVYVRKTVRLLAENAVDLALEQVLTQQARKRGFDDRESGAFRRALVSLMDDFTEHGDHDLLPAYLKEAMRPSGEALYLERHKYVWETLVAKCKELLREALRDEGLAP
jgi:hypothetical protein